MEEPANLVENVKKHPRHLWIIAVLVVAIVMSLVVILIYVQRQAVGLNWFHNGTEWVKTGEVPECPSPLEIAPPVDISKVTGILYPVQFRGNDYKPHGGFRFDNSKYTDITVTLPADAFLFRGSRYIQDDLQYSLDFIDPCGIMYRFDHLVDISPAISHIMDQLPEAKIDDSRTTDFSPVELIPAGTVIATSVGYPNNVSVDFGVYDLRKRNAISADANWAEMHKNESETAYHGICWLEYLSGDARESVLALPAGGGEGKMSDYCL